jgi:hypothetical protein
MSALEVSLRCAALRLTQRQKNFAFDMTPLAGFSRKVVRIRSKRAIRIFYKIANFLEKPAERSIASAFRQPH